MPIATGPTRPIEIFFSYAREDEILRNELEKQLSNLKWQGMIITWYDRMIIPGMDWTYQIDAHLNTASIILLLISPDFMASAYCYGIEMMQAIERCKAGEACVIPIILRPVDWTGAPFSDLQALPSNAQPVTTWQNPDEAFLDITVGIRKALKEGWLALSDSYYRMGNYQEAFTAYEQVVHLDRNDVTAWTNIGHILFASRRYSEALEAYQRAVALRPQAAVYA